jgi:hypothetical protein
MNKYLMIFLFTVIAVNWVFAQPVVTQPSINDQQPPVFEEDEEDQEECQEVPLWFRRWNYLCHKIKMQYKKLPSRLLNQKDGCAGCLDGDLALFCETNLQLFITYNIIYLEKRISLGCILLSL